MSKKTDNKVKEMETDKPVPHICGLRLVSGEDVICILTLQKEHNRYIMQNPALIFLKEKEDAPGSFQIAFSPFCPAAHDGQISIVPDKLVGMYAPTEEIADQYRKFYRHPNISVPREGDSANDTPPNKEPKFEG